MKKLIFLFSFLISLFSCDINLDDDPKYYRFSESDFSYIPTIYEDTGKVITFKNDLNEEIKLEVVDYNFTIEQGGGIGESKPIHTYDKLKIELKVTDSDLNCDFKRIEITKWGGYLITRIITRTSSDPCTNFQITEKLEFPYEVSNMKINNITYDKVVTTFNDLQPYFSTNYSFNKVYFDFKKGIIGFDDTENNTEFRIVNE